MTIARAPSPRTILSTGGGVEVQEEDQEYEHVKYENTKSLMNLKMNWKCP